MSALTLAHWDVEQHPDADRVKVDFIVRRNIRKLQMPRPILIQATTWLDNKDKFLAFLEVAQEHFGDNNSFLYVECDFTEVGGRKKLAFDELPVMTAVGNIVSFFDKANDHNVFRLRMSPDGNVFRRVSDPPNELRRKSRTTVRRGSRQLATTAAAVTTVADSNGNAGAPAARNPYAGRQLERQDGHLKAWKSVPGESYKDYGWIEAPDGKRYNAYWKAFSKMKSVDFIRDLATRSSSESPWIELDLPVTFRVEPPQPGGKHPRAVEIDLVD